MTALIAASGPGYILAAQAGRRRGFMLVLRPLTMLLVIGLAPPGAQGRYGALVLAGLVRWRCSSSAASAPGRRWADAAPGWDRFARPLPLRQRRECDGRAGQSP